MRSQGPAEGPRSLDRALDALGDPERRRLLLALLAANPQDEAPDVGGEPHGEALERLVQMRHVHLPKLESYGFVEWNQEAEEVLKGPKFEEIRPLLELLEDHSDELPAGWVPGA